MMMAEGFSHYKGSGSIPREPESFQLHPIIYMERKSSFLVVAFILI